MPTRPVICTWIPVSSAVSHRAASTSDSPSSIAPPGSAQLSLSETADQQNLAYYALYPDMSINAIGLQALHELHAAVREAGGNPRLSSTPTTSWHDPKRRWRLTARPSGCRSSRGRCGGNPANALSGGGPRVGTARSVPAPAWKGTNACIRTPSRTPTSWPGSPLTTGPYYEQLHAQRLQVVGPREPPGRDAD